MSLDILVLTSVVDGSLLAEKFKLYASSRRTLLNMQRPKRPFGQCPEKVFIFFSFSVFGNRDQDHKMYKNG
jgi:hypothetical protein